MRRLNARLRGTTGTETPWTPSFAARPLGLLNEMITRAELYELVWAKPMLSIAKRFNVSSSYLARVCTRLNVPRPARGYWAKLAVGKATPRPSLPDALPGDEITWNPDGGEATIFRATSEISATPTVRPKKRVQATTTASKEHTLLTNVKAIFLAGRLSYQGNYLKPAKRLLPDILATKATLDSALEFANALFIAFERRGHRVMLASSSEHVTRPEIDTRDKPTKLPFHNHLWSPARKTILYVNGTPIGLTILELTESTQMRYVNGKYVREQDHVAPKSARLSDSHWKSTQEIPSGRLCLQAYASYYDVKWTQQWKENHQGDFLRKVETLVREVERCQADAARTIETGKEHAEAEHLRDEAMRRQWEEEENERRRIKALNESRTELGTILDAWEQADRMARFVERLEQQAFNLNSEQRAKLKMLIGEAQRVMGTQSTLEAFLAWRPPSERS